MVEGDGEAVADRLVESVGEVDRLGDDEIVRTASGWSQAMVMAPWPVLGYETRSATES